MFLRNGWYAAQWSHELKDRPIGRTILGDKVVLFRNSNNQVAALEDRCCHRAARFPWAKSRANIWRAAIMA
jgi:phenylpropionate dioxygenase-like ring-hydroxylating dioxygenase large terminal subunit